MSLYSFRDDIFLFLFFQILFYLLGEVKVQIVNVKG